MLYPRRMDNLDMNDTVDEHELPHIGLSFTVTSSSAKGWIPYIPTLSAGVLTGLFLYRSYISMHI